METYVCYSIINRRASALDFGGASDRICSLQPRLRWPSKLHRLPAQHFHLPQSATRDR